MRNIKLGWGTIFILLGMMAFAAFGQDGKVTMAQIKQQHPESAWHWIKAMLGIGTDSPMSTEVQIILLAIMLVPICQIASFWMKWGAKVIARESTMIDYFVRQDPQRTVAAYLGALVTIGGGCAVNVFSTDAGDFVGWSNVFYNVVIVGCGGDLVINKGKMTNGTP